MSDNREFVDDLRDMIKRRQVVAVVGSGVSLATNPKAPSWRALIESGVERCRTLGATDKWCRNVNERLDFESDEEMSAADVADALLSAAEEVHRKLCQNGTGEFGRWLRENFEKLKLVDRTVIRAIAATGRASGQPDSGSDHGHARHPDRRRHGSGRKCGRALCRPTAGVRTLSSRRCGVVRVGRVRE